MMNLPQVTAGTQFTSAEAAILAQIADLADPNANAMLGWDDTDGAYRYFLIGSGLSYNHGTHTLSASGSAVSFGTVGQVPYMNAGGTDFSYSTLTYFASTRTLVMGIENDGATLAGPDATTNGLPGGTVGMLGGTGLTTGEGGYVSITGGTGGNNANGGDASVYGGDAGGGNRNGGNATLQGGALAGGGTKGLVRVRDGGSTVYAILDTATLASTNKTFTFPNTSGTFALATNVALITIADEAADTSCFVGFFTAATGNLQPKTNANLLFNSSSGLLTAAALALGTGSITMTGSIGVTGARVTKLWTTDLEMSNLPSVGGTALTTTVTKLNFLTSAAGTTGTTSTNIVFSTSPVLTTPSLGVATATSINGNTFTTGTYTLTGQAGKTLTFNGSITLTGTDAQTYTFPTTTATLARIDAANTFVGASTASAWVLTSPTITTKISPTTDDGAPLGDTTHNFSDIFLASGALINIANSNWVATHTSGILTVTTGDLRVTSANVGTNGDSVPTLSSTSTLTNKTLTSPTLTTPSAFTTGGSITLAENTSVALDPAGSADGKYTGITMTGVAGYTQAFGDLVYLDPTDSRWEACDANSAAGADGDARGIVGMVVVAGTDGAACTVLLVGNIRADAKFPSFTVNNPIYVSETAGAVTQTQPTTTDVVIRIVGAALTADEMFFNPDFSWITHT